MMHLGAGLAGVLAVAGFHGQLPTLLPRLLPVAGLGLGRAAPALTAALEAVPRRHAGLVAAVYSMAAP